MPLFAIWRHSLPVKPFVRQPDQRLPQGSPPDPTINLEASPLVMHGEIAARLSPAEPPHVLVVESNPTIGGCLDPWLQQMSQPPFHLKRESTLKAALAHIQCDRTDLILLDLDLPDSQGIATLERVLDRCPKIPIIVVGRTPNSTLYEQVVQAGIQDYLVKGEFNTALLLRAIFYSFDRYRLQQLNQQLRERVRDRTSKLQKTNAHLRQSIRHYQASEASLREAAYRDDLTGLLNRRAFLAHLDSAIAHFEDFSTQFAVLFLDLDRFKRVNDSFGHLAGDELLEVVAQRLSQTLRPTDTLARFGGDEFAILLENIYQENDATQVAHRISAALKHPFSICGLEITIDTSIGIVVGDGTQMQADEFLRNADIALYRAKARGRGCYEVFDRPMYESEVLRLQLEADIHKGLKHQEFCVHYQPIWDAQTLEVVGFEALVRWHHPQRGIVPPSQFVPVAEETGAIVNLDWWVMRQACRQMRQWQRQFPQLNTLFVSVNFSSQQFLQPNFFLRLDRIFEDTQLKRSSLKLEITESTLMSDSQATETVLSQLKRCGIQLGIDDFGTGYSSLSYLHRFPLDTLKIDRAFIMRLEEGGKHLEIVRAIVTLAHNLGMLAIAEGVETDEQLELLQKLGCENIQGYLLSKPLDVEAATVLLQSRLPRFRP